MKVWQSIRSGLINYVTTGLHVVVVVVIVVVVVELVCLCVLFTRISRPSTPCHCQAMQ